MKAGVRTIHHHLGKHRDGGLVDARLAQRLAQTLLQMIADEALAHRPAHVKGHGRGDGGAVFILQHNAAHLRPVAVHHQQAAIPGERRDERGGFLDNGQLGFGGGGAFGFLQGIPAQGDDDGLHATLLIQAFACS